MRLLRLHIFFILFCWGQILFAANPTTKASPAQSFTNASDLALPYEMMSLKTKIENKDKEVHLISFSHQTTFQIYQLIYLMKEKLIENRDVNHRELQNVLLELAELNEQPGISSEGSIYFFKKFIETFFFKKSLNLFFKKEGTAPLVPSNSIALEDQERTKTIHIFKPVFATFFVAATTIIAMQFLPRFTYDFCVELPQLCFFAVSGLWVKSLDFFPAEFLKKMFLPYNFENSTPKQKVEKISSWIHTQMIQLDPYEEGAVFFVHLDQIKKVAKKLKSEYNYEIYL